MNRPELNDEGEETLSRAMAPLRTASKMANRSHIRQENNNTTPGLGPSVDCPTI